MDCLLTQGQHTSYRSSFGFLDKPLSHRFYMIDLSGHYFEVLSVSLLLWILHPSALIFPGRVSKPQAVHPNQSVHTAPIISDGRITTSKHVSSLSSHLLALFVAFVWNKESVNRTKAQSCTASEHQD